MAILRQRSQWYQCHWQQWEVVTTPSSEKGSKDELWGVKCLHAWGEQRHMAPQVCMSWVTLHQTGIKHPCLTLDMKGGLTRSF